MPPRVTEAEDVALTRRAIAAAKASASTDEEFVRILRSTYFTTHPVIKSQLAARTRSRGRSGAAVAVDEGFLELFSDPRFVKNARALAERAGRRLRVIGGVNVKGTAFPDCVAVGSDAGWACTGTLIAPTVVLTAGHCAAVATRVYFGNDVTKRGTQIAVKQRIRHPDYVEEKRNDLLLLILEKPARAKPRRIASAAAVDRAKDGRVVGFGNIDANGKYGYGIKREVDVPIGSPRCAGKVGAKTDASAYGCARNLEMVAGKPLLSRDTCSGDSGGPFYTADGRGGWLLAGATSRSTRGALRVCGDGGIYERVDQYRDWIEKAAKIKLS
jgi:secreted trypsin-like serine protease